MLEANKAFLSSRDVIVANYPGSGASWFSSLFIWLDLFYISGYDEQLVDTHSRVTKIVGERRRNHLDALRNRDSLCATSPDDIRVISTHETPQFFGNAIEQKVVLLVRDGRDAVVSHYHAKNVIDDLNVTLVEYLGGDGGKWPAPAYGWAFYNCAWLKHVPPTRLCLVKFEDCKREPERELSRILEFLEVSRSPATISRAIAESSYERMAGQEDAALQSLGEGYSQPRIMRGGKPGGWKNNVDCDAIAHRFHGFPRKALDLFGYE